MTVSWWVALVTYFLGMLSGGFLMLFTLNKEFKKVGLK